MHHAHDQRAEDLVGPEPAQEPVEAADESKLETAGAETQEAALIQQASLEDDDKIVDEALDDEEPIEV